MSNEFVMVPREQLSKIREWIESARDGVLYPIARDFEGVVGRNAEGLGQETPAILDGIDELLVKQAMHLGEPVLYYKPLIGAEAKPTGECYSVFFTPMPGHQPLFASAEPSAPKCKSCGQVPEGQGGEYPCKACGLPTVHDEPSAPVEIDNQASGCCCPPKGYSGIWAAAMCPVHQGIRRLERKSS